MKPALIACALALGVSQSANASISTSLKMVCDKASETQLTENKQAENSSKRYSSLLSSQFNATSCNGQALLRQVRADNSENLNEQTEQANVIRSTD